MIEESRVDQVDQLLRDLREGPVLLADSTEVQAQRERLLPALRAHVLAVPERRRRRRARRRALGVACTLSALAAAWVVVPRFWDRAPSSAEQALGEHPHGDRLGAGRVELEPWAEDVAVTLGSGSPAALAAPVTLEAKGEVRVSARSALTTARGVRIELDGETRVGLDALSGAADQSQLRLVSGRVSCSVPSLGKGSFAVVTPDAQVVVHGTEFTVEVRPDQDTKTCVRVSEGLVEVRHANGTRMLGAGTSFGCEAPPQTAEVSSAGDAVLKAETNARRVAQVRPAPRASLGETRSEESAVTPGNEPAPLDPPRGTLAEETELFSRALSAERRGDAESARSLYTQVLERYPHSPLAPDARRGLNRVK